MSARPASGDECKNCGMNDTELMPAESADEPDLLTCYDCGHDQQIWRKTL